MFIITLSQNIPRKYLEIIIIKKQKIEVGSGFKHEHFNKVRYQLIKNKSEKNHTFRNGRALV